MWAEVAYGNAPKSEHSGPTISLRFGKFVREPIACTKHDSLNNKVSERVIDETINSFLS